MFSSYGYTTYRPELGVRIITTNNTVAPEMYMREALAASAILSPAILARAAAAQLRSLIGPRLRRRYNQTPGQNAKQLNISFPFNSVDLTLSLGDFLAAYINPAVQSIAEAIENDNDLPIITYPLSATYADFSVPIEFEELYLRLDRAYDISTDMFRYNLSILYEILGSSTTLVPIPAAQPALAQPAPSPPVGSELAKRLRNLDTE